MAIERATEPGFHDGKFVKSGQGHQVEDNKSSSKASTTKDDAKK